MYKESCKQLWGAGGLGTPSGLAGHQAGWKTMGKQMVNEGFRGWGLPRADPGVGSAPPGAPGGLRGCPGAHFGVPGGPVGAPGSDFRAPKIDSELRFLVSGALRDPKMSTKLLVTATEIILSTRR